MSAELSIILAELWGKMEREGQEHLGQAYATGKGYAAAKSGKQLSAGMEDARRAAASIEFNAEKASEMLADLDHDILAISPSTFDSIDDYMAELDRIFDSYASRANAYAYYAEQSYLDGFVAGAQQAAPDLAADWGVKPGEVGFFWRTAADERVCLTCEALDGQWFPAEEMGLATVAHVGCRCGEFFELAPNPEAPGLAVPAL